MYSFQTRLKLAKTALCSDCVPNEFEQPSLAFAIGLKQQQWTTMVYRTDFYQKQMPFLRGGSVLFPMQSTQSHLFILGVFGNKSVFLYHNFSVGNERNSLKEKHRDKRTHCSIISCHFVCMFVCEENSPLAETPKAIRDEPCCVLCVFVCLCVLMGVFVPITQKRLRVATAVNWACHTGTCFSRMQVPQQSRFLTLAMPQRFAFVQPIHRICPPDGLYASSNRMCLNH